MGELEDQIARLAQHRADQVPPYRAPASLSSARGRHRAAWFVAAAAIVTAIAVVAGAVLWDRGDDPSVRTGPSPATELPAPSTVPPTTPPTTAPPVAATCPGDAAADANAKRGAGRPSPAAPNGRLGNVQIQTSECADYIAFQFGSGLPDWSVEYRPGPFTLDPSGQPVDIEGSAFLFVRFEHAEGARFNDLPPDLHAGPLSHVTEVRQTQDFEGIVTWIIGLDARLPFVVVDRSPEGYGRIAIVIPEPGAARDVTCNVPELHMSVRVPSGWYTELSEQFRCRDFGPAPFVIVRQSDAPVPVFIATGAESSLAGIRASQEVTSTTSVQTADGRTATCIEGVTRSGIGPIGTRFYYCEVPWDAVAYLSVSTSQYSDAEFPTHKTGVRAIVESARYLP
jgi:hypothetical protein